MPDSVYNIDEIRKEIADIVSEYIEDDKLLDYQAAISEIIN